MTRFVYTGLGCSEYGAALLLYRPSSSNSRTSASSRLTATMPLPQQWLSYFKVNGYCNVMVVYLFFVQHKGVGVDADACLVPCVNGVADSLFQTFRLTTYCLVGASGGIVFMQFKLGEVWVTKSTGYRLWECDGHIGIYWFNCCGSGIVAVENSSANSYAINLLR